MKPQSTEWAYLAGFFDGDGCITSGVINRARGYPSYVVVLSISQKKREPLDWVKERFGGRIYDFKHHGIGYVWKLTSRQEVSHVLLGMIPYLVLKRRQAAVAINMTRLASLRVGTEADKYASRLKELKR